MPGLELDIGQAVSFFGTRRAFAIWKSTKSLMYEMEDTIKRNRIKCDFRHADSFYVARKASHLSFIRREYKLAGEVGIAAEFFDKKQLRSELNIPSAFGGMVYRENAELNPIMFVHGMARRIGYDKIYENTKMAGVEKFRDHFIVHTKNGDITCNKIILATEAYTNYMKFRELPVLRLKVTAIATERLSRKLLEKTKLGGKQLWGSEFAYNFIRTTADNRVIITDMGVNGCVSNYVSQKEISPIKKDLIGFFPDLKNAGIEYAWQGYVGLSLRLMPFIGEDLKNKNLFYSVGYGGHGMTFGFLGGKQLAEACSDVSDGSKLNTIDFTPKRNFSRSEIMLRSAFLRSYLKLHELTDG